jgi:hypothetical protein
LTIESCKTQIPFIFKVVEIYTSLVAFGKHVIHIWTVIIPRERYGPEGFSPRVDISLFIAYFNIELQRTKLTSTAYTKLVWVIDIGWVMITVLLWKKSCIDLFIERLDIVLSAFSPRYLPWADNLKLISKCYLFIIIYHIFISNNVNFAHT